MKKVYSLLIIAALFGISSCGLISNLIPDVETEFSHTYTVNVGDNSNETDPEEVDVKSSEEYEDFKNNIGGFSIDNIVFMIENYNAPEDMWFNGVINASAEGQSPVKVGTINRVQLSTIADNGEEYDLTDYVANVQTLVDWLDSPGKFSAVLTYNLTDETGDPYKTEDMGYYFDVKVIYKVTVETEVK